MATTDQGDDASFTCHVLPEESLSEGIVRAVAAVSGRDPVPGDPETVERALEPLYSVVDPDALEAVFEPAGGDGATATGHVTFPYAGYEVTVHSEGRVSVTPADPLGGDAPN